MSDAPLLVVCGSRLVGRLAAEATSFTYEPTWLATSDSFPISVHLPLRAEPFGASEARSFFFNLLPEGHVRRRLAARLGLSEGNDYALLAAVGGECAGALGVLRAPEDTKAKGSYEPLSEEDLERRIASGGALSSAAGEQGVRLSLAGAQDKLPVFIDGRGELYLPKGPAASSHILKFENRDFKQLTINEALVLRLGRAVGLTTVDSSIRRIGRWSALVVERYDRRRTLDGMERIHQEDLCQALGLPAERKYEAEGGPSFARCVDLVRRCSTEPLADVNALIRWQIFNAAVGNADGHAKNLALLHRPTGPRLAPFYDLVSTRAYPRVDRHLAMGLGGRADPDTLTTREWTRFAEELRVGDRYVRETAAELTSTLAEAVSPTVRALEQEYGRRDFLRSSVVPAISKTVRKVAASLKK